MPVKNATQRFSSRVDNYVRYRPGYPGEVLDLLKKKCSLTTDSVIADIASGTGIFTRVLLDNGNRVFGVEPNAEMRRAGEEFLRSDPGFTSVAGTAEATTLPDHAVNIVTAAQAAHWFDREKARREFIRILKPGGWCVLIWNERRTASTPFLQDYEQLLLTYGTDYQEVRHERTTATIHEFFATTPYQERIFNLCQQFDYEGAAGRLLSSSYAPLEGHPDHAPMMSQLQKIFHAHAEAGKVEFEYDTRVFFGKLKERE